MHNSFPSTFLLLVKDLVVESRECGQGAALQPEGCRSRVLGRYRGQHCSQRGAAPGY